MKRLDRIDGTADVVRIQADGSKLQIVELLRSKMRPRRQETLIADPGFEVAIPENAQLGGADAQGPNGQPISISPQQLAQKGHYSLPYPLKPGETRFQLAYEMPYNGEATFSPALLHSWNHVVLVLPPSVVWKPTNAALFQHMDDQRRRRQCPGRKQRQAGSGSIVSHFRDRQFSKFAGSNAIRRSAACLAELSRQPSRRWVGTSHRCAGRARKISLVDSWSLGRSACRRSLHLRKPWISDNAVRRSRIRNARATLQTARDGCPGSNVLLEAMKEELFQLEIERQQGVITQEDYENRRPRSTRHSSVPSHAHPEPRMK